MPWTTKQKIEAALRLPWTVVPETTPEGDRLLRVAELPAAVGCGATDNELADDFWESLEGTLLAYFEFGDPLPRPKEWRGSFPWEQTEPQTASPTYDLRSGVGSAAAEANASTSASLPVRQESLSEHLVAAA